MNVIPKPKQATYCSHGFLINSASRKRTGKILVFRNLEMEANEHQSIDEKNNSVEVLLDGRERCIYRVPQYLRKLNEEAYTPRLISIGPLHHGKYHLLGMESHKKSCWLKFKRQNKQKSKDVENYIKGEEQRIRAHYSVTSNLQFSNYIKMIKYDALFIIKLFRGEILNCSFLKHPQILHDLLIDLLLLENQLPYYVLNDLYMKIYPCSNVSFFFDLSLRYFGLIFEIFKCGRFSKQPKVEHFTDLLRNGLLKDVQFTNLGPHDEEVDDLPSATKLKESGLKFRGIKDKCFLDISLVKRKCCKWLPCSEVDAVRIPRIEIYDDTEIFFRNLMALEVFHYPYQTYICNYVDLMDYLIDTVKDVDLLVEKEIIVNCVGNNEVIAKMFNKLCSHISPSRSCYYGIAKDMKAHYNNRWYHLKATLRSVYFSNLWTGTATVAAALLLFLTLIQAVCSVMQVF
ncbi:hypothetical protein ACOSP7_003561 [Xanthoceras sorbifolium]